jgi:uncharacterized protein YutE (UPF0331/DUF86 family)
LTFSEDDIAWRGNGNSSYVDLGNPDYLNFTGPITIEAWVSPTTGTGFRNIVAHGYSFAPNGEVFLRLNNGRYEAGSWDGTNHLASAPMYSTDIGNWVHLAAVYDGTTWALVRDGSYADRTAPTTGPVRVNAPWAIGARGGGGERSFAGRIRNVAIWNTARNLIQIDADRIGTPNFADPHLLGFWALDEGTGGATAFDYTPHGLTGSYMYGSWAYPYALEFNGSNAFVDLGNPAALNVQGAISLQAWVKPYTLDGMRNILAHGYTRDPNGEVYLRITNGQYQVGAWNGTDHVASAAIPREDVGHWVCLCGTYDGVTWRLYRNGEILAQKTDPIGAVPVPGSWAMGARGGGGERFWQGQIRHAAVWNRTLNITEVWANFRRRVLSAGDGSLVGYWPCTEGSGAQAVDHSRVPNANTIHNAAWVEVRDQLPDTQMQPTGAEQFVSYTDHALALDGTTTYVDLGAAPSLNIQGAITMQAWLKPAATDGLRNILAHGYTFNPAGEVFLRLANGQYQVGSWDGTDHYAGGAVTADDLQRWTHICGVYNGSVWILYRNGQEIGRSAPTTGPVAVNAPWAIGARGGGGDRYFAGQLRHVALWNRALAPATIAAHAATQDALNITEAGLVGYWPLGEGTGTAAVNAVNPTANGTIHNAAWQDVLSTHGQPYLVSQARLMQDYRPDPGHPGQTIEISGFRTVLSARTATGAPLRTNMSLWGTAPALIHFPDGTTAVLDTIRPLTRATNAQGELSFVIEAQGQLTTPLIKVRADFMGDQERLLLAPDRQAHQQLGMITGDQLRGLAPPPGALDLRPAVVPASVTQTQADAAAGAMRMILTTVVNHDVQPTVAQVASRDLGGAAPLPPPRPYIPPYMQAERDLGGPPNPLRDDMPMHMLPVDQPVRRMLNVGSMGTTPWVLDLRAGTFTQQAGAAPRGLDGGEMVYLDDASRMLDGLAPLGTSFISLGETRGFLDDFTNFFTHTIPDAANTAAQETANFFNNTLPATATTVANQVAGGVTGAYTTAEQQTTAAFQQAGDAIKTGGTVVLSAVSTTIQQAGQLAEQVITGIRVVINTVVAGVQKAYTLVLQTVEDAGRFVGSVLDSLGTTVQNLINYLKSLFNWGDIVATQLVIEDALLQIQRVIREAIATLAQGQFVDDAISRLQTLINTNFDSWITALTGHAAPVNTDGNAPPQDVQSKYLQSLFNDNISRTGGGLDAFQLSQQVIAVAQQLATRLQAAGGTLFSAETFQNSGLNDLLQHPEHLLTLQGIADLLGIIKPLLNAGLSIAGAVIHAMLELMGVVLNALLDLFTTRINIPILTDFVEQVVFQGQSQLTVVSLVSLLAAVPFTIIYKLASGHNRPPITMADTAMLRNLHWSDIWARVTAAFTGTRELAAAGADARDVARPDDAAWNAAGWALGFVGIAVSGVIGTMTVIEDLSLGIAEKTPFGIVKLVLSGVNFLIGLPLDVVRDGFTNTPSDLNFALWLSGLVGLVSSIVGAVNPAWGDKGDPGLATFFGVTQVAMFTAIWVLKDQMTDPDTKGDALEGTTNILSTLQGWPQFLKYTKDTEAAPIAFPILAAVDGFSYATVAAFNLGRTADDIHSKA